MAELERDIGALLTGEMVPRGLELAGVKGLKEPGGAGSGGDARLAPANASACSERASGALLKPPCRTGWWGPCEGVGRARRWGGGGGGGGGLEGSREVEEEKPTHCLLRVLILLALLALGAG